MSDEVVRWQTTLRRRGVHPDLAKYWASLTLPQVEVLLEKSEVSADAGSTRFGGIPDLAENAPWPTRAPYERTELSAHRAPVADEPRPLSFLCQIYLADLHRQASSEPFGHSSGLLSYFFDAELQPWGFDPADRRGFRVIYTPKGARLSKTPAPRELTLGLQTEHAGIFRHRTSIPDLHSLYGQCDRAGQEMLARFQDQDWECFEDEDLEPTSFGHAIGGWPANIQGDMQLRCALASDGISCGYEREINNERVKELSKHAHEWRLLMQLVSDENLGWMWGDSGTLHLWRNEQRPWTILQCF